MRRSLISLISAVAVLLGTMLVASPAQAAPKPVSISKVSSQSVGWSGTVKHAPVVKKNKKKASVKKKTVTVYSYSSKKTVAKNKKSVKLKTGKYKVTAKATYKYKGKTKTIKRTYKLTVKQGACATSKDVNKLVEASLEGDGMDGDSIATVQKKLRTKGVAVVSLTLREVLQDIVDNPHEWDDEDVEEAQYDLDNLAPELLDSEAIQLRDFRACGYKADNGINAIFIFEDGQSSLLLYLTPDMFD